MQERSRHSSWKSSTFLRSSLLMNRKQIFPFSQNLENILSSDTTEWANTYVLCLATERAIHLTTFLKVVFKLENMHLKDVFKQKTKVKSIKLYLELQNRHWVNNKEHIFLSKVMLLPYLAYRFWNLFWKLLYCLG